MKKILLALFGAVSLIGLTSMVRAGVDAGPDPYYDGYYGYYTYDRWYGPGWYWGGYYDDPYAYYAYRRDYRYRPYHYYRSH